MDTIIWLIESFFGSRLTVMSIILLSTVTLFTVPWFFVFIILYAINFYFIIATLIITLSIIAILLIIPDLRRFIKDYVFRVPLKTTRTFGIWYGLVPFLMFTVSIGIIWLKDKTNISELINLLPIILMQLPVIFYDFKISNIDNLSKDKGHSNYNNGLNKNIIKRERASINFTSIIAVIVSYGVIFLAEIKLKSLNSEKNSSDYTGEDFLIFLTVLSISISIIAFLYLRYTIYRDFIHVENATIRVNKYKNKNIKKNKKTKRIKIDKNIRLKKCSPLRHK